MKDTRVINLDQKESEWLQEIEKLTETIKKYDETIQDAQLQKQKATEEMEKFNRWIRTANEMYGRNGEGNKNATEIIPSIKNEIAGLDLKQAIRKILSGTSKGLTTAEITNILLEHNFESKSKNFGNVVFTSLYTLTKQQDADVITEKRGGRNYYKLKQKSEKREGKMIQSFFK